MYNYQDLIRLSRANLVPNSVSGDDIRKLFTYWTTLALANIYNAASNKKMLKIYYKIIVTLIPILPDFNPVDIEASTLKISWTNFKLIPKALNWFFSIREISQPELGNRILQAFEMSKLQIKYKNVVYKNQALNRLPIVLDECTMIKTWDTAWRNFKLEPNPSLSDFQCIAALWIGIIFGYRGKNIMDCRLDVASVECSGDTPPYIKTYFYDLKGVYNHENNRWKEVFIPESAIVFDILKTLVIYKEKIKSDYLFIEYRNTVATSKTVPPEIANIQLTKLNTILKQLPNRVHRRIPYIEKE